MRLPKMVLAAACAMSSSIAFAQRPHVVGHIPGYKCMMLNITATQAMDPNFHELVYSQPSEQATVAGYAALQIAVPEPPHIVNGFEQALFPTGATVWIRAADLTAYHSLSDPAARCVPARLSNGRYGFDYPRD